MNKETKPRRGPPPGSKNALKRGNETTLLIACTRAEKAGWVKAASPGKLSEWVRNRLNAAAN